jgi:integrase
LIESHPLTGDMAELLAVWRGVEALEPAHHPVKALVKLLILCGVRVGVFACSSPGQIAALTWRAVKDLDKPEHARIEMPAELRKTGGRDGKTHLVPLVLAAVKLLQGLAYVGPDAPIFSHDGGKPLTMSSGLRDQLRTLADKAHGEPLEAWTVHDLRRSRGPGLRSPAARSRSPTLSSTTRTARTSTRSTTRRGPSRSCGSGSGAGPTASSRRWRTTVGPTVEPGHVTL